MDPPLVEVKSYSACFKHVGLGLFVTAHCQGAVPGASGECWGGEGGIPALPGQALPLLLRVLVLLGGGMLGHNSLGQEIKGGLAAGAGFFFNRFFGGFNFACG